MKMSEVIAAAESKFGTVLSVRIHAPSDDFVLLIHRSNPASENFPCMTIRGNVTYADLVSFLYGHYDQSLEGAREDFRTR